MIPTERPFSAGGASESGEKTRVFGSVVVDEPPVEGAVLVAVLAEVAAEALPAALDVPVELPPPEDDELQAARTRPAASSATPDVARKAAPETWTHG